MRPPDQEQREHCTKGGWRGSGGNFVELLPV